MDTVRYQVRNKTLKPTVLPPAKAKGSIRNMSASLGLCLRQHCKLLTSAFLLKTIFKHLKRGSPSILNRRLSKKACLQKFLSVVQ
jgi:hypothetical protein